jgi:hypothetical protein
MQNEPQQGLTLMVSAYCNQQRLPVGGSSQPKSQLLMKKKKEAVCLKSNIPYKCWGWCVCVGGCTGVLLGTHHLRMCLVVRVSTICQWLSPERNLMCEAG